MRVPVCGLSLLLVVALFFVAQRTASAANHPNRAFTFEDRGPEIARLYRLGLENKPEHIAAFCEALKSESVDVRKATIAQLVFTHDASAFDAVVAAMKDESTAVRRGAIAVLEKLGDARAIPVLTEALTFVPAPPQPPTGGPGAPRPRFWDAAGPGQPLRMEEHFNRLAAAVALHRLGSDAGVPTVLAILGGEYDKPVVQMAAQCVVLMDLKQATPELLRIAGECGAFGEDSPGFFAIRALRIMGDAAQSEQIVALAKDKMNCPGGFIRMECLHTLLAHGDESVMPTLRDVIDSSTWREHQRLIIEIVQKLKPADGAALLSRYLKPQQVDPETGQIGSFLSDRVVQRAAEVVAELGDKSVLDELKADYKQFKEPRDYFHLRLYVAFAIAALGDELGLGELNAALKHEDAAVRRMSAKLLGKLGVPAAVADEPAPPVPPAPADTYNKPRYLHVSFDDCTTIESMERFVGLIEELAAQDVRWAPRLYVACLSRNDFEYCTMLLQRCFDRGCEFENHSLHHNPDGQAVFARTADEVRLDCGGGANWLHGNIMGCDRIYNWKSGGGGFERPGDPRINRESLRQATREVYWAKNINYNWGRDDGTRAYPDRYAPPYHFVADSAVGSSRVSGDLGYGYEGDTAQEVIDAFVASFDYWYFNQPEKVFELEGHDWPSSTVPIRIGFDKHWDVLSGFLREVLLNRRERYPLLYNMTVLEILHIRQKGLTPEQILDLEVHLQNSPDF